MLVLAMGILCSEPAIAALVPLDFELPGDAAITLDTETGLRWLDVPVTANLSVADVLT